MDVTRGERVNGRNENETDELLSVYTVSSFVQLFTQNGTMLILLIIIFRA